MLVALALSNTDGNQRRKALKAMGQTTLTFQRMDSLFLGSLVDTAEIIPKIWVSSSSKENLHHTGRNQKDRKVKSKKGPVGREPDLEACLGIESVSAYVKKEHELLECKRRVAKPALK